MVSRGADGDADQPQRVSKILASRGVCSRREAERLIAAGQVVVDGVVVVEQGTRARRDAVIEVTSAGCAELAETISIALHKPVGVVSALPGPGQVEARALITAAAFYGTPSPAVLARVSAAVGRLAAAGRLDRASRGLLVLTTDGVVARALVGGHGIVKTYRVTTDTDVADSQLARLGRPMRIDERQLLPMTVRRLGGRLLRFELAEGMKHQIRRCCSRVGLEVVDLLRESIGPIQLAELPEGAWRPLTEGELEAVRASVVSSPR